MVQSIKRSQLAIILNPYQGFEDADRGIFLSLVIKPLTTFLTSIVEGDLK